MKHIKRAIAAFGVALIMSQLFCMTAYAESESSTISSDMSCSEIKAIIENYVLDNGDTTKAMSVAIYDNEGVIYKDNFGYIDTETKLMADENTVYEWGSVSKLMIWISVMQLYEQGKLDLNEDIQVYLPQGFLKNLTFDEKITMLDLMNHQAGFQETYFIQTTDENEILTLEEALSKNQPKQIYEPGTVTAYSNWGASLAAYIVENISGIDYSDYIIKNILQPLGMKHTAVSATLNDNFWVKEQRDKLMCFDVYGEELQNKGKCYIHLYPAGSITGTLDDFIKFAQAITPNENKACPLFENQETFKEMLTPTSYYGNSGVPNNYHGFFANQLGVETIGHGGNTMACSSMLLFDPQSGVGMVVMTNQAHEQVYNYEMYELIFGSFTDSTLADIEREVPKGLVSSARTVKEGPLSFLSSTGVMGYTEDDLNWWWYQEGNYLYGGYSDMFITTGESMVSLVLVLLFVIGGVYAVITLVAGGLIVSPVQHALRKRKGTEIKHPIRKWNYSVCGIMTVIFIDMIIIFLRLNSGANTGDTGSVTSYAVQSFVIMIMAVILIVTFVFGLITLMKKRIIDSKVEKIKYIITSLLAMIMFIAILVFDMYQFWAL